MFELRPYRKNTSNVIYNPFREMDDFDKAFWASPFDGFFKSGDLSEFKTDISDEGDHYLLEADLPGFDKKDIHLEINGDTLTITAERYSENKTDDKKSKYVHCERSYGKYSRAFDLTSIEANQIKAKYENGVLSLTMPKKQAVSSEVRQLEIE